MMSVEWTERDTERLQMIKKRNEEIDCNVMDELIDGMIEKRRDFNEDNIFKEIEETYGNIVYQDIIDDVKKYIDKTYDGHYTKDNRKQAYAEIAEHGWGMGFSIGNVIKYAKRYGHKGGHNRADIQKIIHYGMLALWAHDKKGNF
jgi:hypothetical protein